MCWQICQVKNQSRGVRCDYLTLTLWEGRKAHQGECVMCQYFKECVQQVSSVEKAGKHLLLGGAGRSQSAAESSEYSAADWLLQAPPNYKCFPAFSTELTCCTHQRWPSSSRLIEIFNFSRHFPCLSVRILQNISDKMAVDSKLSETILFILAYVNFRLITFKSEYCGELLPITIFQNAQVTV